MILYEISEFQDDHDYDHDAVENQIKTRQNASA